MEEKREERFLSQPHEEEDEKKQKTLWDMFIEYVKEKDQQQGKKLVESGI